MRPLKSGPWHCSLKGCRVTAASTLVVWLSLPPRSPIFRRSTVMSTGAGVVTQFDKNDVEDAGLVKFDFPWTAHPDDYRLGGADD